MAALAGAACRADQVRISPVLTATQVPQAWSRGSLRFPTGRMTTAAEIDRALEAIVAAVKKVRR